MGSCVPAACNSSDETMCLHTGGGFEATSELKHSGEGAPGFDAVEVREGYPAVHHRCYSPAAGTDPRNSHKVRQARRSKPRLDRDLSSRRGHKHSSTATVERFQPMGKWERRSRLEKIGFAKQIATDLISCNCTIMLSTFPCHQSCQHADPCEITTNIRSKSRLPNSSMPHPKEVHV